MQIRIPSVFAGFIGASLLVCRSAAADLTLHVSPVGSDASSGLRADAPPGDPDGPLQTVQGALRAARAARKELPSTEFFIEFASGRYELAHPIVLTGEDSGLVISAAPGATVELSGGTQIRGWVRSPTNAALWQTTIPAVREGNWYFQQLFVDGHRATRARSPNDGYFQSDGPLGSAATVTLPFRLHDLNPEWTRHPRNSAVILEKWTDLHLPLIGVNEATRIASFSGGPLPSWMDEASVRYWIENIPEALDAPDEWYLDTQTGRLSYIAPPGVSPDKARITAPRLSELVRVAGGSKKGGEVRGVQFRGIHFTECDYEIPDKGLISQQSAVPVHGAILIENSIRGLLDDCVFENLGGYAVELGAGARQWKISGCQMESLGAGGVRVGVPFNPNPSPTESCSGNQISDNDLDSLGRIFLPAAGIVVFHSGQNEIRHNHIHDLYYTGISVGWTWGYQSTACRDNLIEFNLVERVGQGRLTDMGGIYTLGPQPGTIIRNNVFRDIQSHDYGGWGLYTDEGSSGIVLENNVVYHCKSAGFHQHYGRDNVVRNNLIAFNHDYQLMRTRAEEHRSFVFTNNVVVFDQGELLGSNWSGTTSNYMMVRNLYWDTRLAGRTNEYRWAGQTLDSWKSSGQDTGSIIADPLLVDADHPEKGLRAGSPAYPLGFRPIVTVDMGVRPRSRRD